MKKTFYLFITAYICISTNVFGASRAEEPTAEEIRHTSLRYRTPFGQKKIVGLSKRRSNILLPVLEALLPKIPSSHSDKDSSIAISPRDDSPESSQCDSDRETKISRKEIDEMSLACVASLEQDKEEATGLSAQEIDELSAACLKDIAQETGNPAIVLPLSALTMCSDDLPWMRPLQEGGNRQKKIAAYKSHLRFLNQNTLRKRTPYQRAPFQYNSHPY
ncbi:MAG: hypothetical protein WCG05_01860 [Alphaproteobacteria bacterium]